MTDLWPRLEPLLSRVERPARYLNREWGCVYKPEAAFRFCMAYPDTYELGQSNQAVRILVNCVNEEEGMAAERAFLPAVDLISLMREEGIPLFSIESCAPLREFDAIGITLPHELAATNVLELLDLAGLPLRSADRSEDDPIVIGGGPCAFNPEPYAPFFDAISIGEGERMTPELLCCIRDLRNAGATRAEILEGMAAVPGTYVPSLYRLRSADEAQAAGSWVEPLSPVVPAVVTKRVFEDFGQSSAWEPCIVPFTECVHDRLNVEVLRGCARGCRFCQAGMMYRPVRERTAENIVSSVIRGLSETGYDEVSLTSLSTTDHSQIAAILTQLNSACSGKGIRISLPSQRLDSFGVDMAGLVAGQKKGGLTFAPEAGTQRLRDVINKGVTEDDLFSAVDAAFAAGWRRCKLYFMIGLPTETDDDIKGIASLAERVLAHARAIVPPEQKGFIKVSVSVAVFVPKAQTPFQWDGQIPPEETLRRVKLLRNSVKSRAIDIHWHDPSTSFVEAVMSRGGREVAEWVEAAWRRGARFDAWSELFREDAWRDAADDLGLDPAAIAQAVFDSDYVLPWSHISTGVSTRFLQLERHRADQGVTTPDCTFGENGRCAGCGACQKLGMDNDLAEPRVCAAKAEEDFQEMEVPMSDPTLFRLRCTFRKQGRLAMLSHLEICRALERVVRRADLPYAVSQGFSPHMRISFGAALPVGVGGEEEIFDIFFTRYVAPQKALAALQAASAPDLMVTSAQYIEHTAKAASVALPVSTYVARLSAKPGFGAPDFVVSEEVRVVRKKKEKVLRVADFMVGDVELDGSQATFTLESKDTGSLRPDVFLQACLDASNAAAPELPPLQILSMTRIAQRSGR